MVENGSDRPDRNCARALGGDPAKDWTSASRGRIAANPRGLGSFGDPNRRDGEKSRHQEGPSRTGAHGQVDGHMTSLRQLEANRRNALKSTGPRTENGKQQSRRNALRHGFTAETVIEPLENPEEYGAFEDAIVSEYLPQTPVEQELVHRLASVFWRLRRATSIETGLLRMQSEILCSFRSSRHNTVPTREEGGRDADPAFAGNSHELRQPWYSPRGSEHLAGRCGQLFAPGQSRQRDRGPPKPL